MRPLPVFKQALDECATAFAAHHDRDLLDILFSDETINETRYAQPAIFSLETALSRLWRSWGIEPVAALGHSLGEYAAAHAAGVLGLQDAIRLVAERGPPDPGRPRGRRRDGGGACAPRCGCGRNCAERRRSGNRRVEWSRTCRRRGTDIGGRIRDGEPADGRRRIEAAASELRGAFEPGDAYASRIREDPRNGHVQIAALHLGLQCLWRSRGAGTK